jgi:hypothetical protein
MDGVLIAPAVLILDPEHPNIISIPIMKRNMIESAKAIAGFHMSILISFY